MKTLILYGTKYGTTAECANKLAGLLAGDTEVLNIEQQERPELKNFDLLIIGSSVYMGQINKGIKKFCEEHMALLTEKRMVLFICSGLPENFSDVLKANFPEELLNKAIEKVHFGGRLDIDKMKFMDKTIAKIMAKQKGEAAPIVEINEEAIQQLADRLNPA